MTDEVKKIQQITDNAVPEFPISRRGGYLEESVDDWLTTHYEELKKIIEYQNYCVEVAEKAQGELAEAQDRVAALEAGTESADSVDTSDLEARLADAERRAETAEARVAELENAPVAVAAAPVAAPVADTVEEEAIQASTLLQNASRLAREHVESARADAEKIRENAELKVVDLTQQIEHLEGIKFATRRTLTDFFQGELDKLAVNEALAGSELDEEVVSEDVDVDVEDPAVDLEGEDGDVDAKEDADVDADEDDSNPVVVEVVEVEVDGEIEEVAIAAVVVEDDEDEDITVVDPTEVSNEELLDELDEDDDDDVATTEKNRN
jgi:hypothetical protein